MDYKKVDEGIEKLVSGGVLNQKKIVIYPFGQLGLMVKNVLNNRYGIYEEIVVDERLSKINTEIKSAEFLKEIDPETYYILVASSNPAYWEEIRKRIPDGFKKTGNYYDFCSFKPLRYRDVRSNAMEMMARELKEKGVNASVAEAGVYKGDFAIRINTVFPDNKLYLFDTFEGFDNRDVEEDRKKGYTLRKAGNFGGISSASVLKRMPNPNMVVVKEGYFPSTTDGITDEFMFVNLDMDLYIPTKAGLNFFFPRLVKGGYILIHDCAIGHSSYKGARVALKEFCDENDLTYVMLFDECGTAVIAK